MAEENRIEKELGWDDEIENDSPDFILLPDGEYDFTITAVERARYEGGEKLPPCNKAIVYFKFDTPQGSATIKNNFYLHTRTEGLLCAFFSAIGLRRHGERLKMQWSQVPGSTGRARVVTKKITNKNGEEITINQISKFCDRQQIEDKFLAAGATKITTNFTPGTF